MNITRDEWREMTTEEAEAKLRELIDECNGDVCETVIRHINETTPEPMYHDQHHAERMWHAGYPYSRFNTDELGKELFNKLFIESVHEIAEFLIVRDHVSKKRISKRVDEPIGTVTYPDGTTKEAHEMHFTVYKVGKTPGNTVGFFVTALYAAE